MKLHSRVVLWAGVAAGSAVAVVFVHHRRNRRAWAERRLGPAGWQRAGAHPERSRSAVWRFDQRLGVLPTGKSLRFELASPAIVHWTVDQWDTVQDTRTARLEMGLHVAELPTETLGAGTRIQFTFFWPEVNRWEGEDFEIWVEYARQYAT